MGKYRQHILVGLFAVLCLYFGGEWLIERALTGPREAALAERRRLEQEVAEQQQLVEVIGQEIEWVRYWQTRSLPASPELARSLYREWLLELVGSAGLSNPFVEAGRPVNRQGLYEAISYSVRARGTLEQLTAFLFEFYRADPLHQVRSLTISPLGRAELLDVSLTIEAIIVPESEREDISSGVAERLASENLEDYRVLVDRNFFSVSGSPDPTDQAYLTFVGEVNGEPSAWFTVRTRDEVVRLSTGDDFQVGQFRGRVAAIESPDVILESAEGDRWLLTLGDSLTRAFAIPPGL